MYILPCTQNNVNVSGFLLHKITIFAPLDSAGAAAVEYSGHRQSPIRKKAVMRMKEKKPVIWWLAFVNCLAALCALAVKSAISNPAVARTCDWILLVAWLVQGVYIFSKFGKK